MATGVKLRCLRCGNRHELDLVSVHEPGRVCWDCKAPWVPEDYTGELIAEDVTITPLMAWEWMTAVPLDSGHWRLSPPKRVVRYADLMRSGQWQDQRLPDVDHPIGFDPHGVLLSGLCRLMACIEADHPFGAVVVRFDPVVPGHVRFDYGYTLVKVPRLLSHWLGLRDSTVPV